MCTSSDPGTTEDLSLLWEVFGDILWSLCAITSFDVHITEAHATDSREEEAEGTFKVAIKAQHTPT